MTPSVRSERCVGHEHDNESFVASCTRDPARGQHPGVPAQGHALDGFVVGIRLAGRSSGLSVPVHARATAGRGPGGDSLLADARAGNARAAADGVGLFSVLSYLVEQRTKDFGVRMALSETNGRIIAHGLSQSARPVGIGLLLGTNLTTALDAALLATPAAETIAATPRPFDPVAYAASLLCIVTVCAGAACIPARRAGRLDPVTALKRD